MMTENLLTRAYFNKIAKQWKIKQSNHNRKIVGLLSRLNLTNYSSILDIGCGTGVLFPFLRQMTQPQAKIYAIDFADGMAELAASNSNNRINVVCGDIQFLPFYNEMFDLIIAFQVFPHIHHKILALKECWRVLQAGGQISIIHLHGSEAINAIHAGYGKAIQAHSLPNARQMGFMLQETHFEVSKAIDQSGKYFIMARKES